MISWDVKQEPEMKVLHDYIKKYNQVCEPERMNFTACSM